MQRIAQDFPQYAWDKNKGYPTPAHRAAIELHGATPHHRMSFQLLNPQLTLF
jgi:ribonuclease HII